MSLTVKETGGGAGMAPIEAGSYPARCVGVIDLGIQHNDFNDKDQEKVRLVFELPTERTQVDGEDKPRWLSKPYTASLHEKATLRRDLDAWRGKPFTPEELAGFDLANVLNAPCLLTVINVEGKNGGSYAKISGVSRPMKGMEVPPLENAPIKFDMDAEDADEVLKSLPNWMQEEVKKSVTWKARNTPPVDDDPEEEKDLPF